MTLRLTGSTTGITAGDSGFLRTAYYPGQFLTDRELTNDQTYAAEKRRVQNRVLHGHGVVSGLEVGLSDQAGWVTIQPGLALDPFGNELRLLQEAEADLRAKMEEAMRRRAQSLTPTRLSLATSVGAAATTFRPTVVVALQYQERAVDPQPAFLPQTSPDAPNKAARTQEGFKLVVLLESELDAAARQELYWQTQLLNPTQQPPAPLTTEDVACPYVFLARVSRLGTEYTVDTSVRRPVLTEQVFFDLVRRYAPDLFDPAQTAPWLRDAIVAQLGQVYSDALVGRLAEKGVLVAGKRRIGAPADPTEKVSVTLYVDAADRVIGAGPAAAGGSDTAVRSVVSRLGSPLCRAVQRYVSRSVAPVLQEAMLLALATSAVERLPVSRLAS
ncbi:MAG TPA: hypothetical protein VK464_16120, partial [Symbiobacteriaceae bacterium]|nr:hypothetical protein [Symbiobacteriaceae bacterium]